MSGSSTQSITSSGPNAGVTATSTLQQPNRAQSFSSGHHVSLTTFTSTPLPPVTVKIEAAKRLAAYAAVDAYVKPEHKVIGIGSGTTVPYVLERIIQQGEELNKDVIRLIF